MKPFPLVIALAATLVPPAPAIANDSMAATAIGGITMTKSDVIRMDSEDLFVSEKGIRVVYQFTNTSGQDIETLVAFPLPEWTLGPDSAVPDYRKDLNFRTSVDGQPLELDFVQRASFNGADITERLGQLGLPVMPLYELLGRAVNGMSKEAREALVRDGLVEEAGSDGKQTLWDAKWSVATTVTRRQNFPAGRTIKVEHSYNPMAGGSVGGGLSRESRKENFFAESRRRYCIDDGFLQSLDGRLARLGPKWTYSEVWLSYVLKTGANWAGPIRDFRLVVDKGSADHLVSFCGTGVKKIGPTSFEVRIRDYVPTRDLDVLIVKFHKLD